MTRRYVPLLAVLGLLWGASYPFIKVAGREIEPGTMMLARVLVAAIVLTSLLALRGQLGELRRAPFGAYLLGVLNAAIPFTLIAWGERHISSGLAAIGTASVPIFVALLAIWLRPSERSRGTRLAGVLVGLAGVGVLTGAAPASGTLALLGTLAVLAAAVAYAVGGLWGQQLTEAVSGLVLTTATLIGATVAMLPLGIAQAPSQLPSAKAIGCVAGLVLLGTVTAQLLWFRLLVLFGASRASLVAYLIPCAALVYGVVFLGEHVTPFELAGLILILGGIGVGSGTFRLRRRPAAAVESS
jgi:drug/metabolite transporter (DMT)-like permease